jgi:dTDP-4-amino-4,6-dideoxygalactose transaminase
LPIVLPEQADRACVMNRLRDGGIQTSMHYPAIHLLSFYREMYPDVALPQTEEFSARQLTLPLHPKMNGIQVEIVGRALAHALAD